MSFLRLFFSNKRRPEDLESNNADIKTIRVLIIGNLQSGENNEESAAHKVSQLVNQHLFTSPFESNQNYSEIKLDASTIIQTHKSVNAILEPSFHAESALLYGTHIILICPDSPDDLTAYMKKCENILSHQKDKRVMIAVEPTIDMLIPAIERAAVMHERNHYVNIVPISYNQQFFLQTLSDYYHGQFPPQKPDISVIHTLIGENQNSQSKLFSPDLIAKVMQYLLELSKETPGPSRSATPK